jgi:hypothetical protein
VTRVFVPRRVVGYRFGAVGTSIDGCGMMVQRVVVVPVPLVPVAPTLVRPPFHRDGWIYEEKVDGWRMRAYTEGARVRLIFTQ